jgi:hypothetical protein
MMPKMLRVTSCLAALLALQAFGFSSGNSSLARSFSTTTSLVNSPIVVTATFTNGETDALRGFNYSEQLPSALAVTTVNVTLNGQSITRFTFESGMDGDVYAGLTPRRWRLETPTNFTEANPIPAHGVVQIVYTIAASSAGSFSLQQFTWAACFPDRVSTTFGHSEVADVQTLQFTNLSGPPWVIYWQHTGGSLASWNMSGSNSTGGEYLTPSAVDPGWKIVGVGDFNGDGRADLLWEHTGGGLACWFMDGTTRVASSYLNPAAVDPTWRIVCTGDFNGDGKADILWQHTAGELACWFMDGTKCVAGVYLNPATVDPTWKIVGTGDFNGHGKVDILWQHSGGGLACWFMDGTTRVASSYLNPAAVDPTWRIVGTGDFNGDGKTDILWQQTDGWLAVWYMNGTNSVGGGYLNPSRIDPTWKVAGPK